MKSRKNKVQFCICLIKYCLTLIWIQVMTGGSCLGPARPKQARERYDPEVVQFPTYASLGTYWANVQSIAGCKSPLCFKGIQTSQSRKFIRPLRRAERLFAKRKKRKEGKKNEGQGSFATITGGHERSRLRAEQCGFGKRARQSKFYETHCIVLCHDFRKKLTCANRKHVDG